MAQVHPEEKIRKEGSKIEAQIENYYLQLTLDRELFETINNIDKNNLDPDDKRYHEFLLRDFEDAGQLLNDEERKNYIQEIIKSDLEEAGQEDVFRKIKKDFQAASISIEETEIRNQIEKALSRAKEDFKK